MCRWKPLFNFFLGGVWGCHCRAWWYTQPGWGVEAQLHNLHCVQVLVLPHLVCCLWYPCCSALGLPVCLHLLLPHLGCGSLHQELSDWVAVRQPHLFSLHPDLLWSLLRSPGQNLQQCASGTAQRSLRTHTVVCIVWSDEVWYLFIHQKISPGILYSPWYSFSSFHNMLFPTLLSSSSLLWVLTCPVCLLPPEALWQLQQTAWFCDSSGTPGGLSAPHWGRRGPAAMRRICPLSLICICMTTHS